MKSDKIYLEHIRRAIESIGTYLEGIDYNGFQGNNMLIDALVRELEIIGEAVNNLSEQFKKDNPEIPFRDITDMRNFLIHEYFGVNKKVVWTTCNEDILDLKKKILPFLE